MINAFAELCLTTTRRHYLFLFSWAILFASCTTVKQPIYFQNSAKGDTTIKKYLNETLDLKIQKGDIISIIISSVTPDISVYNSANLPGYTVDNEGNIYVLNLGKQHVEGLTKKELKGILEKQLSAYIKDPLVTVRFLNHTVTVMGEVGHPQTLQLPQDNVSLIEVLGMVGDINSLGRKDNVLIIRDSDSGKQFHRVNLLNTSVFNSQNYYVRPNDIVYVEPKKVKVVVGQQTTQIIGLGLSFLSVLLIIIRGLK